jgi:23S rRNA (adenine2503-C2)-methyltransferase
MSRNAEKPSLWIDGKRPWYVDNPVEKLDSSTAFPTSFYRYTQEDLENFFMQGGKQRFRAQQLFKWVYELGVTDFDQMTNLSKDFRETLKSQFYFELPKLSLHLKSTDGTQKFLFELGDKNTIEAVLIPSRERLTLCISSEVGCNMACKFCFTGKQKLKRRLNTEEIVGQFLIVEKVIAPLKVTNIVFMGMGEPLDNPESVFKTIDVLHNPFGRNFSRKKVTVSTSGLIPEMWRISASHTMLAVSLNGYDDESRSSIMPINKKYPLRDLLKACREYIKFSKEKVTFEYVLLKGITDQVEHAVKLYKLTRDIPCKINIIPFNEHPGSGFGRPSEEQVLRFQDELIRLGAHVLLRKTMGRDIYAACGQLTSEFENKPRYFKHIDESFVN